MPRKALRCCVELCIHAVSAPGVWLPSKEDIYLSISILGHYKVTRLLSSVFPLLIHEKFQIQKTFYTAVDPAEVSDYLEDELVVIELLQLSEYCEGAVRLASYSCCARDFLFPYPSLAPTYSSTDRELLLTRSVAFPGISPKLEFATKTVIKESVSPELDALEDALDQERGRRFTRRSRSPTRRPRSSSLSRRITDLSLSDAIDRPPFVVRKLETDLIGRVPGGGPDAHGKSKGRRGKGISASRDDLDLNMLRRRYSLDKDLFKSRYDKLDDEDAEVSELTSRVPSSYVRPRPRSASPVLSRPSFRARYSLSPSPYYYPSYYSTYSDYLRRRVEDYRLARLPDPLYPYVPYYSSYRPYWYDTTLADLDLSTRLAKTRRYLY